MELKPITNLLDFVGDALTVGAICTFIGALILWARGILPPLIRLGRGLSGRKIALFAKNSEFQSLKSLLLDSKLFRDSNIIPITAEGDIGKAEQASLFLVYWPDWKTNLDEILTKKRDGTALVVYAPQELGMVDADSIKKLNNTRNFVLSNFRGRLLNDLVVCMITTSYEKK